MLRDLFRFLLSPKKRYQKDKKILDSGTEKQKQLIAASKHTNPEILYYMADDPSPKVRREVAKNTATPMHVSPKLAKDSNEEVRLALAEKLVKLLPDLSKEEHSELFAFAMQALENLAEDEAFKVRRALSSSLVDLKCAPPSLIKKLSLDIEKQISKPLLKYCVNLTDDDLLFILEKHPAPWAAEAIAERKTITAKIAAGIFKTKNVAAGEKMLKNKGAQISKETLEEIVEYARNCPKWHEAIALRRDLTFDLARKLVGFANKAIFIILEKRKDFDKKTKKKIAKLIKRRIAFKDSKKTNNVKEQVSEYKIKGLLDSETLLDALAWHDFDFIFEALSQLSGIKASKIEKIVKDKNPKRLIAIVWKAKLPMRLAVELEQKMANIQPKYIIYARGGTDFPFSDGEIQKILQEIEK